MRKCRVRGRQQYADGRACVDPITVTPGRPAVVAGSILSADPITVTPRSDGSWGVELIPSRFVGVYTFGLTNGVLRVRVPDEADYTLGQEMP